MTAALLGRNLASLAAELVAQGADRVYTVDHPRVEGFTDEVYGEALTQIIRAVRPEILLAGATSVGRSFIPKVATQVGTGLTADCTDLAIDPEKKASAADPSGLWGQHYGHHYLPPEASANGHGQGQGDETRGGQARTTRGSDPF